MLARSAGSSIVNSLKNGASKARRTPGIFVKFGERELRFRKILVRHLAQAFFAEQREVHGGGQRAERLVGADVRSGLLAADVLLARGERQDEAAAAFGIDGLARETPGHLTDKFVARRKNADERPAIARSAGRSFGLPSRQCRLPQVAAQGQAKRLP